MAVLAAPSEHFMVEVALSSWLPDLVKVIHVELNGIDGYLPHKRRVIAVFEVTREDLFCKHLLVEDEKPPPIGGPASCSCTTGVLYEWCRLPPISVASSSRTKEWLLACADRIRS